MAVEIRPFKQSDTDGVAALIIPIQRDEFGLPITIKQQPDLLDIEGFYRPGVGEFWLAADGNRIIGSIALIDFSKGLGAIRKMFVHPDYRGRGQGVATRLFESLRTHATINGITDLYLGTTEKFLAAHRFYEKHGFHAMSDADMPDIFPRMKVDTRFYHLALHS